MRRIALSLALCLSFIASGAEAKPIPFIPGWDNHDRVFQPGSMVKYSIIQSTKHLKLTYILVGAQPGKLFQVGVSLFCTTAPAMFGNYPVADAPGPCRTI